jgi:hypothetical protein
MVERLSTMWTQLRIQDMLGRLVEAWFLINEQDSRNIIKDSSFGKNVRILSVGTAQGSEYTSIGYQGLPTNRNSLLGRQAEGRPKKRCF